MAVLGRYGLTSTEWEIMDVIWASENGISFQGLLNYLNENLQKDWKRQTLSTYLSGLQKAGLIDSRGNRKSLIYYALSTREEHMNRWMAKQLKLSYDDSLNEFVIQFVKTNGISDEELEKLKATLDMISREKEEARRKAKAEAEQRAAAAKTQNESQ